MLRTNKKSGFKLTVKCVCDTVMLLAAVLLVVALFLSKEHVEAFNIMVIIACAIFIAASLVMLVKSVLVLINKQINHRSPEFKQAIVIAICMAIVLAIAVFGLIFALTL